jgi:spore coat polysaccharide biosynthesis protein SpsF (cytidylyltransferase family)
MGSTRFPGKVLADLGGRPVVAHVLARARRIPGVTDVALAVPESHTDDPLAHAGEQEGVTVVRGSAEDVLDSYHVAAEATHADAVVRVTADCPLLDPAVSGAVVTRFLQGDVDYVSNVDPPTFPDGYDTEVLARAALDTAWRESTDPYEREHVTPFIRRRPNRFRLANVTSPLNRSHWRLTLDTEDDLRRLRAIWSRVGHEAASIDDIVAVVNADPSVLGVHS